MSPVVIDRGGGSKHDADVRQTPIDHLFPPTHTPPHHDGDAPARVVRSALNLHLWAMRGHHGVCPNDARPTFSGARHGSETMINVVRAHDTSQASSRPAAYDSSAEISEWADATECCDAR